MTNKNGSQPVSSHRVSNTLLRRETKLGSLETAASHFNSFLGQDRAREAAELAATMDAKGFNLFVAAPRGTPAREALRNLLDTEAAKRSTPDDWAYVYNYARPHEPRAIKLPPGKARFFRKCVREMIQDLRRAIPAAFEKQEVQNQRRILEDQFKEKQEDAFETLGQDAREKGVAILRTPMGFSFTPMQDDEVMSPEALKALTKEEHEARQKAIQETQANLEGVLRSIAKWERELRDGMRVLERETVEAAITQSIELTKSELSAFPEAIAHLESIRADLIENVALFAQIPETSKIISNESIEDDVSLGPFDRYDVNVFVDHSASAPGAPVIEENHPTHAHLIGRVEHRAEDGVLKTSFKLIKPGALHAANGGFLILDARRLLQEPMSWQALKRALQTGCIKTESLAEALSLTTTITLEPAPVPLSVKIILIGDALIYHLLAAHDPEFSDYFKLLADFDHDTDRTDSSEMDYALSLVGLAKSKELLDFETGALELLIEEAAREAGDSGRLSLAVESQLDLMQEANHRAKQAGRQSVARGDVADTIAAKDERASRIRDRMQDMLMKGISLISTDGEAVGQINGLSVYQFGGHAFGKPSRITARARPGQGRVIDIEREARLGGPIHSKGVLILTGFLAGRYVLDRPMSLLASIVLEQSYGGVEGDSASAAELVALLSSLSGSPIKQSMAITGALNQLGEIQAIGGANEKIEGFFDLCNDRGLTGDQGVVIPESNVQHLMLRSDVVEACSQGRFHVYSASHLDDALELMIGRPASDIHADVKSTLERFADVFLNSRIRGDVTPPEQVGTEQPSDTLPGDPPSDPPTEPPAERSSISKPTRRQ